MTYDVQKNWIHGQFVDSSSDSTFNSVNPANGQVLCAVQPAHAPEVNAAVKSASEAQRDWAGHSGVERGRVLAKAAQLLRQRNSELAEMEVNDTGKPISEALAIDVHSGADALEYFAGLAPAIKGDFYTLKNDFAYTRREPLGVVAGIGAWNYPLQIACWKSAPALASGNSMVFKPSELTPLTALQLARTYKEAGLPDGVFNVVLGDQQTGSLLVEHPMVKKVSLTGSVETGKAVMAAAAPTLKQISLELGGKSPLIIFDDADLELAISIACDANFFTQGEVCSNGTRVFVHSSLLDGFLQGLTEHLKTFKVGDPMNPSTNVGALISQHHMQKVLDYIERGKSEGAQLLIGGRQVGEMGYFVEPTVFSNCTDDMTIVKEEIFGPVMSVLTFDSDLEVIERANATSYGLAAGVVTKNLDRAHWATNQLEAGICWINTYNQTPVEIPFGGYKQSGFGRENSEWAIQHYTQLKTVYVRGDEKKL